VKPLLNRGFTHQTTRNFGLEEILYWLRRFVALCADPVGKATVPASPVGFHILFDLMPMVAPGSAPGSAPRCPSTAILVSASARSGSGRLREVMCTGGGTACTVWAMVEGVGPVTSNTTSKIQNSGSETMKAGGGIADLWAVIPAGGAGTRLWPLSRSSSPKFLHDMTGAGSSLLQATWNRLEPLCGDHIMVVAGALHQGAVRGQLPALGATNLVAEPSPRGSMAAIGLAAAILERRDPEALLASFAADHVIGDLEVFADCVREAVAVARSGYVVTIGIEATYPATGFGYIRVGDPLTIAGAPHGRQVRSFVEKPDVTTARAFLKTGEYHWNAGMFVVKAKVLLDLLAEFHPQLAADLRDIAAKPSRLAERWPGLTSLAIDNAVAEPAAAVGRVAVVPGRFSWGDVGDFDSVGSMLAEIAASPGLKILGEVDLVLARDTTGVVVPGSGRTVAVLGLDDIVVVDTPDALLVTTRQRAQEVKGLVDLLKSAGRTDLT
jgi:mannose-1-phosphate guanylyltransferase